MSIEQFFIFNKQREMVGMSLSIKDAKKLVRKYQKYDLKNGLMDKYSIVSSNKTKGGSQ